MQNICVPSGTECYSDLPPTIPGCTTSCHGLYADVDHEEGGGYAGQGSRQFLQALAEYQLYKDGGEEGVEYPASLVSK